jgi:hypothetical protein
MSLNLANYSKVGGGKYWRADPARPLCLSSCVTSCSDLSHVTWANLRKSYLLLAEPDTPVEGTRTAHFNVSDVNIDMQLIGGSLYFGIGWGVAGMVP